jgi:predicted acyltransferase
MSTLAESPVMTVKSSEPAASQRLMSVDALRGFDMFWIIGADSLVAALYRMGQNKPTQFLANQLSHAEWEGFHFYDLIFPLFIFIVGVSLVFSLRKALESSGPAAAFWRVLRRGVLLFLVGVFYSGGFTSEWPDMRLMGVLNRIALAYTFAGLLFCLFKPRALAAIFFAILFGYWALMTFVPIRDIQLTKRSLAQAAEKAGDSRTAALFQEGGNPSAVKDSPVWAAAENMYFATTNKVTGKFGPGYNLSDHMDFRFLPGKKYDQFYDPEGIVSTLPAIATCLLGVFAGLLLRNSNVPDTRKLAHLVGWGLAAVALGWIWDAIQLPVIKKIWTSSYVLVAGGYSALLLALFYFVVDMCKLRAWCQPFVWMGMNSITIYLASNLLGSFRRPAARLVGGDIRAFFEGHVTQGAGDMVISIVGLLLAFWFVRFLYKRKIFLRL